MTPPAWISALQRIIPRSLHAWFTAHRNHVEAAITAALESEDLPPEADDFASITDDTSIIKITDLLIRTAKRRIDSLDLPQEVKEAAFYIYGTDLAKIIGYDEGVISTEMWWGDALFKSMARLYGLPDYAAYAKSAINKYVGSDEKLPALARNETTLNALLVSLGVRVHAVAAFQGWTANIKGPAGENLAAADGPTATKARLAVLMSAQFGRALLKNMVDNAGFVPPDVAPSSSAKARHAASERKKREAAAKEAIAAEDRRKANVERAAFWIADTTALTRALQRAKPRDVREIRAALPPGFTVTAMPDNRTWAGETKHTMAYRIEGPEHRTSDGFTHRHSWTGLRLATAQAAALRVLDDTGYRWEKFQAYAGPEVLLDNIFKERNVFLRPFNVPER